MTHLTRRRFLQSASLLLASGAARPLFPSDPQPLFDADDQPSFPKWPVFEPLALFLTWQNDPTTTMTIQWIGAEKDAADRPIWYAQDAGGLWQHEHPVARPFPMTDRWIFRTELTGLQPGTDYRFHVGLDSAEHRFRTMPAKANNTIHFVSGGDSGIGPHAVQTNRLAAAQSPMFVVLGGDLAYENARAPGVFLQFLKNYSRDLRDDRGRMIPLLGCIGNHEVDGGYEKTRRDAPFFYSVFDGLFLQWQLDPKEVDLDGIFELLLATGKLQLAQMTK